MPREEEANQVTRCDKRLLIPTTLRMVDEIMNETLGLVEMFFQICHPDFNLYMLGVYCTVYLSGDAGANMYLSML